MRGKAPAHIQTLEMAAELRLPSSTTPEQRSEYLGRLVATLGLSKAIKTRVGDRKRRGLSGGERKRLSIGCEIVGSPSLIFLDEPTTGLDAFAAQRVRLI
jgi:ABC-type multidrug transport system ATPase subunit